MTVTVTLMRILSRWDTYAIEWQVMRISVLSDMLKIIVLNCRS